MENTRASGHLAESTRNSIDFSRRNSRIDDREDDDGNAGAAIFVGGVVSALVIGALAGFIKFVQVML